MEFKPKKEYIVKLLNDDREFIIPLYQRPYKWDIEKCETLWGDILSVFESTIDILYKKLLIFLKYCFTIHRIYRIY